MKFTKCRIHLSALLLFTICTVAGAVAPTIKAQFYSIEKGGKTSYILGTFHFRFGIEQLPVPIQDIMGVTQQFAGEKMFEPEVVRGNIGYGVLQGRLREAFNQLKQRGPGDIPLQDYAKFKLFGVPDDIIPILRLSDHFCKEVMFADFIFADIHRSMDFEILSYAQSDGKKIFGLENETTRQNAYRKLPNGKTAKTSQNVEATCTLKLFSQMTERQAYAQFVGRNLVAKAFMDGESEPDDDDVSLVYRNRSWISQIENLHKKESTFFFVGVGHLGGQGGIVEMLRKSGFKVRKLEF